MGFSDRIERVVEIARGFAQVPGDVHRTAFDGNTRCWAKGLGELADYLDVA